jgi:ribonuclease HI
MLVVNSDGGASPNPGEGGIGFVVFRGDKPVLEGYQYLGDGVTNNQAEFSAAINGLSYVIQVFKEGKVTLRTDSRLVYGSLMPHSHPHHMTIRNEKLLPFANALKALVGVFTEFTVEHISRDENKIADILSRTARKEKTVRIMQLGE